MSGMGPSSSKLTLPPLSPSRLLRAASCQDGHVGAWHGKRVPDGPPWVPQPWPPPADRVPLGTVSRRSGGPCAQGSLGRVAQSPEDDACGGDKCVGAQAAGLVSRKHASREQRKGALVRGLVEGLVFRDTVCDGPKRMPPSSDPDGTQTAPLGEPHAPIFLLRAEYSESPYC